MKEKVKKIILKIIILILSLVFIYLLIDGKNLYVDMYNFRQLEKVKIILKDLKREDKKFNNLNEFNEIYNVNIKSTRNCYYLRNYKSEDRVLYTFWFKLESYIYIYIYWDKFYAYPKYDLPVEIFCWWWPTCGDINKENFERVISNPCEEN